ncbi:MAG: condensation domain-containing protein [Aquabacterium sp.]|nr:condensation domain-containing protein [Aquabacterium sp.]
MTKPDLIPLNRSEHMYWAGEGYLGSISEAFMLRFDGPVDTDLIRQALHELVMAYPRMRGVIESTGLSYQMRILSDALHIDQLFAHAFQVQQGVDASSRASLETFHNGFINEAISLERGMPWRARLIPHPTQPALMLSVHHIIGDGRSVIQMLCAIMARLSGEPIKPCKVDSHSMLPAAMPLKWWHWPASITRWWRQTQADKQAAQGLNIVSLRRRSSTRYTTTSVKYHELACPADTMKALAKAQGTTVNTLLSVVIANTFLAMAADDPKAAARLRIAIDLRRYFPEGTAPDFGNFVFSFPVLAQRLPTLQAQIASIEGQVKHHLARCEHRDYALPLLVYELIPLLGRTLFSYLILRSKAKNALPPLSCFLTNLGSADFINPKTATTRLTEFWPTTLSTAFLIAALSLNGKQLLTLTSQDDEIPPEAVQAFRAELDAQISALMTPTPSA